MARDIAHDQTDDIIEQIEKRLQAEYEQAAREAAEKYDKYMKAFARKDAVKRQMLAKGLITKDEYIEWRTGQICIGQRWEDLKNQLAEDLMHTDSIARSTVQEHMSEVYALNHNYAVYNVERQGQIDTAYTLYNRRAVENLVRDDATLLPYPTKDGPTDRMLRENKDLIWNKTKIHNAITQGVLQGESIPQIRNRLMGVVNMDKAAATRNARTMMTGVENKARIDAHMSLRDKGVNVNERWTATLDGRTRHSHRYLHGTYRDPDTGQFANGCEYPGDPSGPPEEVYNCRCRLVGMLAGYETDLVKSSPKMEGMTFDEWLEGGKGKADWIGNVPPITEPPVAKKTTMQANTPAPIKFENGQSANVYFGQRPSRELRRENREEYDRQREQYEQSMFKTWYDSMTESQIKSIGNYTGDDYSGINGLLRHHMTEKMVDSWNQFAQPGQTIQKMIQNIEDGINNFVLNDSIKVFRTCDPNILENGNLVKGAIFKDNAFVSTTTITEKVASGNVVMEIDIPAGKGIGAWINPLSGKQDEEYEFLLNRGATFEVTDRFTRGEDTVITMKWIDKQPEQWSYATREEVIERMKKEGIYDPEIAKKI